MKNISISDDLHRRFKTRSAEEGKSMGKVLEALIEDWLGGGGPETAYGPPTIIETSIVKDPPTQAMAIVKASGADYTVRVPVSVKEGTSFIEREDGSLEDVTRTVRRYPTKMPDLSKAAQLKGRMAR